MVAKHEKMKKLITGLVLTLLSYVHGFGQVIFMDDYFADKKKCGEWIAQAPEYSSWKTIDTITYNPKGDTLWIESGWESQFNMESIQLVYYPCGSGSPSIRIKKRVCGLGIVQEMFETINYTYVEPEKTEYEKKIEQLKPKGK